VPRPVPILCSVLKLLNFIFGDATFCPAFLVAKSRVTEATSLLADTKTTSKADRDLKLNPS
jgi:hypothetical protein